MNAQASQELWQADRKANMKETKHTPGPWKVLADPAWRGVHPLHDARFVTTADVEPEYLFNSPEGEENPRPWRSESGEIVCTMPDAANQKANARLIAAAPDLLRIIEVLEQWRTEGGHFPTPSTLMPDCDRTMEDEIRDVLGRIHAGR